MGRCDMPEERIDEHLEATDRWHEACAREYPASYDEWNAINVKMGRPRGTFLQYLDYCRNHVSLFSYNALTYFGAIDDDDFIGDEQ